MLLDLLSMINREITITQSRIPLATGGIFQFSEKFSPGETAARIPIKKNVEN